MFFLYSILYSIVILVLSLPQYLKRPAETRKRWFREKLGLLPRTSSCIWVHAVSVGEVGASINLIRRLRTAYPDLPVVLSTVTDTGQRVAMQRAPEGVKVVYLPFDIGFILRTAIRRTSPEVFITIETEIWPNAFRAMSRRGVPVVVLNGRISEKSARGYRRISFFMKKVFRQVSLFGMQSELDARRLQAAGADPARVVVTGNFKFDMERPAAAPSWTAVLKGPVIVAGSTFEGEEELVLSAYRENIARFPGLRLVLAPRHPERFAEAAELLRSSGVYFKRRSELPSEDGERAGVFLLDTMGELSAVYGVADIVIIGKSFSGYGGQNPLEPAYWGKAIICGPHMENFPFMGEFYEAGAAFEVEPTALAKKIRELLLDPGKAGSAGEKARALYEKNSGAVGRAMEVLKKYLP